MRLAAPADEGGSGGRAPGGSGGALAPGRRAVGPAAGAFAGFWASGVDGRGERGDAGAAGAAAAGGDLRGDAGRGPRGEAGAGPAARGEFGGFDRGDCGASMGWRGYLCGSSMRRGGNVHRSARAQCPAGKRESVDADALSRETLSPQCCLSHGHAALPLLFTHE